MSGVISIESSIRGALDGSLIGIGMVLVFSLVKTLEKQVDIF